MEQRPGLPQQASSGEGRSLTSLNPIARVAAMTASGASAPTPSGAQEPSTGPTPAPAPDRVPAAADASAATLRPSVGRLEHVVASRLWTDAVAFAGWLADNLDPLGEALSVRLRDGRLPHPETPVIVAVDASGETAVIVCELGDATDEGFGRLVRNVAASKATHAVWVCGEPGDEYGASVSWLNRADDARVSMVKVSAVVIGESAAAPMFEVRVRTPREADEGVESTVPASDPSASAPATRRVDDWLESVGAGDTSS